MIAADTSSLVGFIQADDGADFSAIDRAMNARTLRLPPIVLTELLSFPQSSRALHPFIIDLPTLPVLDGYWERAGESRRLLLSKGLKARTADALIAQSCIDNDVPLIARDRDYRHFAQWCGLRLA